MFKKQLSLPELLLIGINLIPVWGVWFDNWNAAEVFIVYCLESIIIGFYNIIRMLLTTWVKKKEAWGDSNGNISMMSGYFFIFFFVLHYGFFVFVQLSIFFGFASLENTLGVDGVFDFILHFRQYMNPHSLLLLLCLIAGHGVYMLKDFVFTGGYKRASLNYLLFQPYGRILVQQFTVIVGSLFLFFGAGKLFITIFVFCKMWVETYIDIEKYIRNATQKLKDAGVSQNKS